LATAILGQSVEGAAKSATVSACSLFAFACASRLGSTVKRQIRTGRRYQPTQQTSAVARRSATAIRFINLPSLARYFAV
jgi:hypothetical protein